MLGRVVGPITFEIASLPRPNGRVSETVAHSLCLPLSRAEELLNFGAVYYNGRRLDADREAAIGAWLRVHTAPRRFATEVVDWRARVVFQDDEFLVLDKPHGIPSHATCDNAVENVLHSARTFIDSSLLPLHRLDVATGGIVVFAKTPEFQRHFSRCLENRGVRKRYRALVPISVEPGLYEHFMDPVEKWPRTVGEEEKPGWKRCALRVESSRAIPDHDAFEVEMDLLTGRNHQIRSQLSRLDAPLLGDHLYGSGRSSPISLGKGEVIALQASAIVFLDRAGQERAFTLRVPW